MRYHVLYLILLGMLAGCKNERGEDKQSNHQKNPQPLLDSTELNEVIRNNPSPDLLYPELFHQVQTSSLFPDSKAFADATPKASITTINEAFRYQVQKVNQTNLQDFIQGYFDISTLPEVKVETDLNIQNHIQELWTLLTKQPEPIIQGSSLLPLPNAYVVPGGRFREIYYWDSYFTMLGLAESGRYDLINSMVDNFAHLINQYGHIPNGNRSYFLSRSQPPFLALMVDSLAKKYGEADIYKKYLPVLEKEYSFWMNGHDKITDAYGGYRRVVKTSKGAIMNRYWDDHPSPRPEAYKEDVELANRFNGERKLLFRNIRAAAESGWDFSTRWTAGSTDLINIQTTFYVPVDLNSLMYNLEKTLAVAYNLESQSDKSNHFQKLAEIRKSNINEYCWVPSANYYMDYHWRRSVYSTEATAAGVYPLFFKIASKQQAEGAARFIENILLREGGVVTTVIPSGQQWDAPNGWAPLQWMAYQGLKNYGYHELANKIAYRWTQLNEGVYKRTGKLMEKYNVTNTSLVAGGGEYPTQDGFGWTNGVYLKLLAQMPKR